DPGRQDTGRPWGPRANDWRSLRAKDGDELEAQYRHTLEHLATQPGMLGEIFKKARPEIQNPAILRRLIVDLIDKENWFSMQADVKGDIYEGLLARSAEEGSEPGGFREPGGARRTGRGDRRGPSDGAGTVQHDHQAPEGLTFASVTPGCRLSTQSVSANPSASPTLSR